MIDSVNHESTVLSRRRWRPVRSGGRPDFQIDIRIGDAARRLEEADGYDAVAMLAPYGWDENGMNCPVFLPRSARRLSTQSS
jgi:hypothetical protein